MKQRLVVTFVALVAFVGFSLLTAGAARAQATDDCVHTPTITSLQTCVEQAAHQGFIDNQGVTNSLLAQLDTAQAALDRGQTLVAINTLQAFINEVQAQAGKHIVQPHAGHLIEHAQLVIQALQNG
jgi:hypothetical protein